MKNPTFTFGDLLLPTHPPRKCLVDFMRFDVWRKPTQEELEEDPNIIQISDTIYVRLKWIHVFGFGDRVPSELDNLDDLSTIKT